MNVTEVTVSAGRKKQLDQYEPIDERATFTAELQEGDDAVEVAEYLRELAWAECEEGVQQRYEEYVREDVMGE